MSTLDISLMYFRTILIPYVIFVKFISTSSLHHLLINLMCETCMLELIAYESLVQEANHVYHYLVDSKRRETDSGKEKSQYQNSSQNTDTVEIYQFVNKLLKNDGFKSRRSENGNGSGLGSSAR